MVTVIIGMLIALVSFTLSASVGLGGSLILVPAMALAFGTKSGIAIAAILLSLNNVGKVYVYRSSVPFASTLPIIIITMIGAATGATAMLLVDEFWVDIAVMTMILSTFLLETIQVDKLRKINSHAMAYFSGCTSGFSGTSGPLKGLAIRSLDLERMFFVGAASVVSLFGDVVKASIYTKASLLTNEMWVTIAFCILVIPIAVSSGKRINNHLGEKAFASVFWLVMTGYTVRLFLR